MQPSAWEAPRRRKVFCFKTDWMFFQRPLEELGSMLEHPAARDSELSLEYVGVATILWVRYVYV